MLQCISMNSLTTKLSIRVLKDFALSLSWAIPCLFVLILPWLFEHSLPWWPFCISVVLMLLYWFFPIGIKPIYILWMKIAGVIGWVNTRLILAIVFYVIILPIGLLLRLFGKLQFKMSESEGLKTYWKVRETKSKKEDLERPF